MLFQMVDAADGGGFSRAGRAAQHDAFAGADMQINVFQYVELSVPLIDVFQRNHHFIAESWLIVAHVMPQCVERPV